ncbi:uncharacterized protein PpBr36_10525 [Pyricularia pennisetigena]|uniref:uncharacterized protein n=1 Tax=Pyricularia pennisetigena TaxID=1578925 RepID=UPI00114DA2DD|nr:uncharacterized protein PpBr36_10525 [Pyricularia pennisetigena]TLS21146.1 hypothetical protein PpBr36_10525 [Pyricularia pennisetigena]
MGSHVETPPEVLTKSAPTTLNGIAAEITRLSAELTKFLEDNKLDVPTFEPDSPTRYDGLTAESFMTRQHLIDRINDMWLLAQGPSESIFNYVHNAMPDAACLNVLNYFDFWSAVPLDGSASYQEIAKKVRLPLDVTRRVVQHGLTIRLFASDASTGPGRVRHTARSAALARAPGLRALVSTVLDEAGAPMMVMHESLDRYSRGEDKLSPEMEHTAFAHLHAGKGADGQGRRYVNSWDMLENDGEGENKGWRQRNFVEFMRYLKEIFRFDDVISHAYDWEKLGDATVVDVGGSAGHDAVVLARKFPSLRIHVQDLPKVAPVFASSVPAELSSRVTFTPHDFFNPQPVSGADVYMLKMILHDWPDHECARILRALIPALKPGAKVILVEYVGGANEDEAAASLPDPAVPRSLTQMGTATDLRLMALFNAKERPLGAWKGVFEAADQRFKVKDCEPKPGEFFAVIEAEWTG